MIIKQVAVEATEPVDGWLIDRPERKKKVDRIVAVLSELDRKTPDD